MAPETDITGKTEEAVALDNARITEGAALKYPHNFWSAYKGHVRGLLTGTTLGGAIGAAIGLALAPFTAGASVALLAGIGVLVGAEEVGSIGASTAASASGVSERHARWRDPANAGDPLKATEDKLMYAGNGHHYEFPPDRDRKKLFHWKSGLTGAIIGIIAGALIGVAIPAGVLAGSVLAIASFASLAGAAVFGLLGLSFGIERGLFKSAFNKISALTGGKSRDYDDGVDIGLQQELAKGKTEEQVFEHRLARQEDMHNLQEEYDQKIFSSGVRGYIKGLTGGSVVGGLVGAAVGLVALGIAALATTVSAPFALIALFIAGFGMYFGKTFAEAGKLSGTESAARAIDDEFERRQILQAQGITELPEKEAPKKTLFNPLTAVTMGIAGAAIGAALAPAVIPALIPVTFLSHLHLAMVTAHGIGTVQAAGFGTAATAGGLLGVLSGFGDSVLHGIAKISSALYNKTYAGDPDEADSPQAAPQIARSPSAGYASGVTDADAQRLEERLQGKNNSGFVDALYNPNKTSNLQIAP